MWRKSHALHHAGSGHLEKSGIGDITTLTVSEYRALSLLGRVGYRIYRHPIVMFVIGPAYLFLLQQRLPVGAMNSGVMPWASTMWTNAAVLAVSALLIWFMGWGSFLSVHLPVVCDRRLGRASGCSMCSTSSSIHLGNVMRTGRTPRRRSHGSSFYDLPKPLMWITGNIGIHHLHHLCSRIPFYRLRKPSTPIRSSRAPAG